MTRSTWYLLWRRIMVGGSVWFTKIFVSRSFGQYLAAVGKSSPALEKCDLTDDLASVRANKGPQVTLDLQMQFQKDRRSTVA
jgi:hypothetical protein